MDYFCMDYFCIYIQPSRIMIGEDKESTFMLMESSLVLEAKSMVLWARYVEFVEIVIMIQKELWGQCFNIKDLVVVFFSIYVNTNMLSFPINNLWLMWVIYCFSPWSLAYVVKLLCFFHFCILSFASFCMYNWSQENPKGIDHLY